MEQFGVAVLTGFELMRVDPGLVKQSMWRELRGQTVRNLNEEGRGSQEDMRLNLAAGGSGEPHISKLF